MVEFEYIYNLKSKLKAEGERKFLGFLKYRHVKFVSLTHFHISLLSI